MAQSSPPNADVAATPADTLRNAAAYLTEHGWIQGMAFADHTAATPAACAYGAIRMAVGGHPRKYVTQSQDVAIGRAIEALVEHLYPGRNHGDLATTILPAQKLVTEWNDHPDTTAGEAFAALAAAARAWDRRHPNPTTTSVDESRRAA
jgi:hypothetical protein